MKIKAPRTPLSGRIEAHPDGYAFFVADDGTDDLFIPSGRLFGAMHGDKVLVVKKRFRGRPEAHVLEIKERGISKLICRVEVKRKHMLGVPMHRRFSSLLILSAEAGLKEDDVVLCEIGSYPKDGRYGRAKVLERLGNIEDKGIENSIVMNKYGLEREFPANAGKEAAEAAKELPAKFAGHVKDHRGLFTVTIDGESARDFDDAISVEKHKAGYSLYVHIADVSRYVKEGSPLDAEAYRRGTSVYFPEFAIPMLPEILSNGSCSLRPNEERFTLTAKIDYDGKGRRTGSELYESVISSDHRLTYTYVNEVLSGKTADGELAKLIKNASFLAGLIKKRREEAGAVDFDLPEVEIVIQNGDISDIFPLERGESERIIENFMIEANEVAAENLLAHSGIYRNHGEPDMEKLITWAKTARSFGISVSRIEGKVTPSVVQKLFGKIPDRPWSYMIKSLLVRSMQRAEYAAENKGHFGLASGCYTHFTSPIRRYPDLLVHRLLKHFIFKNADNTAYKLDDAARRCSEMERNAEDAEREVVLYKKLAYLRNNPENLYAGFITKAFSGGFSVFIEDLLIYGTVDAADIPKGRSRRRLSEGDEVELSWVATDIDKLQAYFTIQR